MSSILDPTGLIAGTWGVVDSGQVGGFFGLALIVGVILLHLIVVAIPFAIVGMIATSRMDPEGARAVKLAGNAEKPHTSA